MKTIQNIPKALLYTFLVSIFFLSSQALAQCDLPSAYNGNTGQNMTVMMVASFLSSLNVTSESAYLVALSEDGSVVGSQVVAGVSQIAMAVWADDSSTPGIDGALTNESISFQLVDGPDLYDVTMPTPVYFINNSITVQLAAAMLSYVNCNPIFGCTDPTANNYDATANVYDGSCIFSTAIEYQLSVGWNMVGYTGTADNNGIVEQMDAALGNGAGTANTFQVIKNVSGQFWSSAYAQITTFNQGQGYMMYVNGSATTVNFQQSSGYISGIEYSLSAGWNMVAFTGDVNAENNIVSAMDAALGNGASTANTFQVIKNVSGQFWSTLFAQISTFNPGQAYMMYVNGSTTTVNFQQN